MAAHTNAPGPGRAHGAGRHEPKRHLKPITRPRRAGSATATRRSDIDELVARLVAALPEPKTAMWPGEESERVWTGRIREPGYEAIQGPARRDFESLDAFLARVEKLPPPGYLVPELLPDEGIAVWHGRPRSMKSLCALETLLAIAKDT